MKGTKLLICDFFLIVILREEHNMRSTLIDCAPGTVILAGTVKIMPALLTNQMTGIFQWSI